MKIIKWPIIYIIVQFGLLFLLSFYYTYNGNDINLFNQYLTDKRICLVIILAIIFIPIFISEYKKLKTKEKKLNKIYLLIFSGIILSIFYNCLAFYFDKILPTNLYSVNNNILITLLSTGLIGPIIEELLFRGIMYNEAKKKYSNMKSILIVTTIFALMHPNIIQMIYAFGLGFILIYVYEKYQNIKASIILHMASNITTTLFTIILIKNNFLLNYILFIGSLVLILVYYIKKIHTKNY